MPQLINSIADVQNHLSISKNFDWDKLNPSIKRGDRKFIISVIGDEQYDAIAGYNGDDRTILRVKNMLSEASATYGVMLAIPTVNNSLTNSGVKSNKNEQTENASWHEVRDLIRTYGTIANEALDESLRLMESNPNKFLEWSASEFYTVFTQNIVQQTSQFDFVLNNRMSFIALKPYMKEVEEQYLKPLLGDAFSKFTIKSSDVIIQRGQELARSAVNSLTIAKVAATGTFLFTPSGLMVNIVEMPWEKNKLLSEFQLENLRQERQNSGEEYLKKLKTFMLANTSKFEGFIDNASSVLSKKIIAKKSHLSL